MLGASLHVRMQKKIETPPPELSGFAEIRRLKKANLREIKIKNMGPWRP